MKLQSMAEHGFERVASLEAETEAEADRVHAHASYGKACLNCVRSKTKCARSGSRDQCERYVWSNFSIFIFRLCLDSLLFGLY